MAEDKCEFPQQGRIMRGDRHNIMMELLKQTAFKEDRRTYANNFTPIHWTQTTYKGKYFVRGMRGIIDRIHIYAKNEGAVDGTITITITNYPLSEISTETVTITIPAGSEGWFHATPLSGTTPTSIAWNYDMCFLYVSAIAGADVWYAFDKSQENPDAWVSPDSGTTWRGEANGHYHLKIDLLGQTIGDVPVTGFVNIKEVEKFIKVVLTDQDGNVTGIPLPLYAMTLLGSDETYFNGMTDGQERQKSYVAGDPYTGDWVVNRDFYPYSITCYLRAEHNNALRPPCLMEYEGITIRIHCSDGQRLFTQAIGQNRNIDWDLITIDGTRYWTAIFQTDIIYRNIDTLESLTVYVKNSSGITLDSVEIYILGSSHPIT